MINIDVENNEFQLVIRPSIGSQLPLIITDIILFIILFYLGELIIVNWSFKYISYNLPNILAYIGIGIIVVIIMFLITYSIVITRLIMYANGIEYYGMGHSTFAEWQDIERINRSGGPYSYIEEIILSTAAITTKNWLMIFENNRNKSIPIWRIDNNWRTTEWGQYICKKANLNYWRIN